MEKFCHPFLKVRGWESLLRLERRALGFHSTGRLSVIDQTSWNEPPSSLDLMPNQVHLWCTPVEAEAELMAGFQSFLSPEEKTRANRFRFSRDRSRFVVSRGVLRVLLSGYLRTAPEAVRLVTDENRKPFVPSDQHPTARAPIRFNTSHSESWAVFAFSKELELGIDIECVKRDVDYEAILERQFTEVEKSELRALSPDARRLAFFRVWTRKEACLKATGDGLRRALDSFTVPIEQNPGQPISLTVNGLAKSTMYPFVPALDYEGALVVEGSGHDLQYWRWKPGFGRISPQTG